MILGFLAGLLWFALFFAAHLAVIRWMRLESKAYINQRLFLIGLAGIAISLWPAVAVSDPLYALLLYGGRLAFGPHDGHGASTARRSHAGVELREEFVWRGLVGQRLATMATNGFLIDQGDGYALSSKGR
jgi:hypothetical protein